MSILHIQLFTSILTFPIYTKTAGFLTTKLQLREQSADFLGYPITVVRIGAIAQTTRCRTFCFYELKLFTNTRCYSDTKRVVRAVKRRGCSWIENESKYFHCYSHKHPHIYIIHIYWEAQRSTSNCKGLYLVHKRPCITVVPVHSSSQ